MHFMRDDPQDHRQRERRHPEGYHMRVGQEQLGGLPCVRETFGVVEGCADFQAAVAEGGPER